MLHAEQEGRVGQHAHQALLDPVVERSGLVASRAEEAEQHVELVRRHRAPPGAARHRAQDLGRAGFVGGTAGPAREQPVAGRRGSRPRGVERAGDLDAVQAGVDAAEVDVGLRAGAITVAGRRQHRHADTLYVPVVAVEGHPERMLAGRRRDPQPKLLVGAVDHVAAAPHLAQSGLYVETLEALAVQPQIDQVASVESAHVVADVERVALQVQPDLVLAVRREVVAHGSAAAGAERQVLVHPHVLHQREVRQAVHGGLGPDRGIAERQTADLLRRQEVAFEQPGRHRQHLGDVVEALQRVVAGQQRLAVDLQRQQIPDGVRVLGPVQAVDRRAARVRRRRGMRVQRRLQLGDH